MAKSFIFLAVFLAVLLLSCFTEQQADVTVKKTCLMQKQPLNIFASGAVQLQLKHPIYKHLHPNQHCEMRVRFQSNSSSSTGRYRWLVSVLNASMKAYSATATFYNSINSSSNTRLNPPLTSETPHLDGYQFVTEGDNFSVVFGTKQMPEAFSTGLVLLAEPFDRCPTGWFDTVRCRC